MNEATLLRAADASKGVGGDSLARLLCFLLCVPSGGALLAKMYGLASMQFVTVWIAVPCCVLLVAIWIWARHRRREWLANLLEVGFVGGLVGTIGYDIARIPFHLAGQRIFAPISAYGVWIADAEASTRYTHVAGWLYHFSNGITFGIMYVLCLPGRHWIWAVAWAFALETIAVASPFGRVFSLSGNYPALAIAYFGHLAYGVPLGWMAFRLDRTIGWLAVFPRPLAAILCLIAGAAAVGPLLSPALRARDARAEPGTFLVEGNRLNPEWLRIERGGEVVFANPGPQPVTIEVRGKPAATVAPAGRARISCAAPGVYRVHVKKAARSHSSFILVEPVEQAN